MILLICFSEQCLTCSQTQLQGTPTVERGANHCLGCLTSQRGLALRYARSCRMQAILHALSECAARILPRMSEPGSKQCCCRDRSLFTEDSRAGSGNTKRGATAIGRSTAVSTVRRSQLCNWLSGKCSARRKLGHGVGRHGCGSSSWFLQIVQVKAVHGVNFTPLADAKSVHVLAYITQPAAYANQQHT